MHGTGVKIKK